MENKPKNNAFLHFKKKIFSSKLFHPTKYTLRMLTIIYKLLKEIDYYKLLKETITEYKLYQMVIFFL